MKMRAIVCTAYGTPDVLELQEIKRPMPKDDEVRIRIHAAAVTTAGLSGRTGKPYFARLFSGLTRPKKSILGMELAGEIEALGQNVKAFKKGDRVFGITGPTFGAHADYICLSQHAALIKKPNNSSYEESVAVIEGGLTALNFLKNKGKIKSGQKVLIYGASGSVGTASLQLAKHFGAAVTGVCSTANVDMVQSLGADTVIDYTREDVTQTGRTYDLIFDTVGKLSFPRCKDVLGPKGIYLDAAGLSTIFHMLWTSWFSRKKAILTATYLRSARAIKKDLEILRDLVEAEKIRPVIDRYYPLEQTAEAHRYVETGRKKGNVVITTV